MKQTRNPRPKPSGAAILGVAFLVILLLALSYILGRVAIRHFELPRLFVLWLLGAASLGILTGYVTGASKEADRTSAFLSFLAAGVVAPLFGQIAVLVGLPNPTPFLPLAVLGGFFLFYSFFAALGFLVGVFGKREDIEIAWRS